MVSQVPVKRRSETTGASVFSLIYAEPNGKSGAGSALTFPNFFPKLVAGSTPLAVEEQARIVQGQRKATSG